MRNLILTAVVLALPLAAAAAAEPKAPTVSILLRDRHGQAAPARSGTAYSGGGNIDVQQPAADTIVITLTGAVVATDHPCGSSAEINFDLDQIFDLVLEQPDVKGVKLTLEARTIGLLRNGKKGTASESGAVATVGAAKVVSVALPDRTAPCGESISVNDKSGPVELPTAAGSFTLHVGWRLTATHPKALLGKSASAEFAPDPAIDPLWVGGPRDPFHGAAKKDFGFQIILKANGEAAPAPKTALNANTASR